MARYGRGEYRAFEEIYRRHAGRVYGFLKGQLRQPGEAEDILQGVFLRVHQHRESYDSALPFLTWLFSITRHLLIDHLRKHRPTPLEDGKLIALADAAPRAKASPDRATWDEVMKLLPADQRALIEQRFREGLSFDEIAERSEISAQSARKRVSRTIQTLRETLGVRKGGKS